MTDHCTNAAPSELPQMGVLARLQSDLYQRELGLRREIRQLNSLQRNIRNAMDRIIANSHNSHA